MCELFPIFKSCCGIPVRIALVFIAILSIVTGAMINAGLKKAGVNISNIDDVKDLNKNSFMSKNASLRENTPDKEVVLPQNETDIDRNVIVVKPKRTTSTSTTTEKGTRAGGDDASKRSTVEILGDEIETTALANPDAEDEGMVTETLPMGYWDSNEDSDSDTTPPPRKWTTTTQRTTTPAVSPPTTTSDLIRKVSSVNRNGINLLACAFVLLGILLLAANFTNSSELALLYVVLSLVNSAAALCLLVGVVSECTKAHQSCLLSKMDWFSGFLLTLFWFIYIFLWLFFAGVANAFANGVHRPVVN